MTKVTTQPAPKGVVKVTRKVVALLDELKEARATSNSAERRVKELREDLFAEVGKQELTLTHNSIEVARIVREAPMRIDEKLLAEKYPEAYQACLRPQERFVIRAVTRKK